MEFPLNNVLNAEHFKSLWSTNFWVREFRKTIFGICIYYFIIFIDICDERGGNNNAFKNSCERKGTVIKVLLFSIQKKNWR